MTAHTFLFEEGVWEVSGQTIDEDGEVRESPGDARIVHWPGVWLIETKLTGVDESESSESSLEVVPATDDTDHTSWTAFDSRTGKQHGHFVFVNDTILSIFECSEGAHRGTEVLRKLEDDVYESIGAHFDGDRKVASWTRRLTRRSPA